MALPTNLSMFFRLVADVVSGALSGTVKHEKSVTLTVGNAAGQANIVVQQDVTLTTGAPLVIDLTAVQDVGGALRNMATLTHWAYENQSDTVGQDVTVGGGANPVIPADAEIVQAKGGFTAKAYPYTGRPVAGATKNLQLAIAAGVAVPGRLSVWGRA